MRLEYFPYYCGGKILTGLYFHTISDDEVIKHSLEHQVKYNTDYITRKLHNAGYYYAPRDKYRFYELIEKLINHEGQASPSIGTIIAVTNKNQLVQGEYLKEIGFKMIGSYNKHKYLQNRKEDPTYEATCLLWNVDVHNVLIPKLEELKIIREKKNEPSKRAFKST